MKNAAVTMLGVVVLAIATTGAAFGAQASLVSATVRQLSDALGRAALQGEISGQVIAGVGSLPSTSTGGGADSFALALGGLVAVSGAFILVRKAILDR